MRKEKFIIHLRKTLYKKKFLFAIFQFAPTTLYDLINQKALKEMHMINLVDDMLTMTENYMKYKIIHGDIRPTKIMALIDSKIRKPFKNELKYHKIVNHHTEIDPMLSGFKKFARVTTSKGELYPSKMYEEGTGIIDMTDLNEVKKPKIVRYESNFRPYEIWAYKDKKFSPGSDMFALGITLFHMIKGHGPSSIEYGCSGILPKDCQNKFYELEKEISDEISHCFGWERCLWYLISKMTLLSPLERISPKNAKKDFIKCLHKLDFEFEEPPKV
jgi:serine/threonine protein kinase